MPTMVFALLCASLVFGAVLIVVGRRGRRLNNHPVCRWCGFDVSGTYPASYMCPECGGGLKRENGVRIGVRKRMVSVMVVGAAMVLLPLAPIGIAFYGLITGANLNTWKPVGILLWEAGMVGKPASEAIAKELVDRLTTNALDKEQEETVAARVVEFQKDLGFAWTDGWGQVCELLKARGGMTTTQWVSLTQHSLAGIRAEARPRVRPGEALAFRLLPTELRLPGTAQWSMPVAYESLSIDDRAVTLLSDVNHDALSYVRMGRKQLGLFTWASTGIVGVTGRLDHSTLPSGMVEVPKDLPIGTHMLNVRVRGTLFNMASVGLGPRTFPNDKGLVVSCPFEVVDDKVASVQPVKPSVVEIERLRTLLATTVVRCFDLRGMNGQDSGAGRSVCSINLTIPDMPSDIACAFELFARVGGREVFVCVLTSSEVNAIHQPAFGIERGTTKQFSLPSEELWTGPIDLILRPSAAVAHSTLDLTTYADAEIVVKGIDVIGNARAAASQTVGKPAEPASSTAPIVPTVKPSSVP